MLAVHAGLAAMAAMLLCTMARADEGCSKPITITSGEWAPYNYVDERGRYTGMDVELSRAIVREAGCTLVELARMPPMRNTHLFEIGKVDMMAGASRTPERSRTAFFSLPYRTEKVRLFAPAAIASRYMHVKSFSDVMRERLTVLAPRIGWYGQDYHAHMAELKSDNRLSQFNEFPDGIKMLAAGRAVLILGDQASVIHAAASGGIKVAALPFGLVDAPIHLMLNKQTMTAGDVRRLDAAIERLRRKGVIERIRRSYGGPYGDS
ncbi:transporter substrate-binding domain-containing protein [Massilia sp. PAMC28688]|uniref:substrate-binding periplasmic protein n=1 Tax=Massilia sp. PAMC28688 TaxID=2861283 RepID=UPI001C636BFE|nr:transporter substrate-binding domain-containing protein [Massilia sp. PAMC28688]QYF94277.1 transporter substrate-binding domain-containing protein [Massilia sp. PAMC28688]